MHETVSVSIIVANFNGAGFLGDAIKSASRQTLREIEIIVSDDGSTDNSIEIVERMAKEDPRIRPVASDRNLGPGAARNRALASATGR